MALSMASRHPSSSLRSRSNLSSWSCSSNSAMRSMAFWRWLSAWALAPTATASKINGAATVMAPPAATVPTAAPVAAACRCRLDGNERRLGDNRLGVAQGAVDAAGDGTGLHRLHEALADLRGDLGGDHHPVEHLAGLRDLRDGGHALGMRRRPGARAPARAGSRRRAAGRPSGRAASPADGLPASPAGPSRTWRARRGARSSVQGVSVASSATAGSGLAASFVDSVQTGTTLAFECVHAVLMVALVLAGGRSPPGMTDARRRCVSGRACRRL